MARIPDDEVARLKRAVALLDLARASGAPEDLALAIAGANTARHVEALIDAAGFSAFYRVVAARAASTCNAHVGGRLELEVVLFDFDGRVHARALDLDPCRTSKGPG